MPAVPARRGPAEPLWGHRLGRQLLRLEQNSPSLLPPLACEHPLAPRSHLLLSRAWPPLTTSVSPGWQGGLGQGVRSRGAACSERAQPVLVSPGSTVLAPATTRARPDRQLSYHGPEGKQGQRKGKAPLSSIPSFNLITLSSLCGCTDDDGAHVLPPPAAGYLLTQAMVKWWWWGFRGSCTNWCCFSSWVQLISVPLLLACSDSCISAEVQSVAGFDVFC